MRLALLLFALPLAAQTWSDVRLREGAAVFQALHPDVTLDISVDEQASSGRPAKVDIIAINGLTASTPSTSTVSFSPQGAKVLETLTGKRISGVGIHDLVICSPGGASIRGGAIYQLAVAQGIQPISPALARALFRQTVQRNWRNTVLRGAGYASLGIPVLGQAGVISMTSRWIVSLLSGHVVFDALQSDLRANLPDPEPVLGSLLDPEGIVTFAGNCRESKMVTRFGRNVISGTFLLP
jgi:hypothetical protein